MAAFKEKKEEKRTKKGEKLKFRDPCRQTTFLRLLAEAKAKAEPPVLRMRVECAWKARWGAILACAAARALLNLRGGSAAGGDTPASHEVMHVWRHLNLGAPD